VTGCTANSGTSGVNERIFLTCATFNEFSKVGQNIHLISLG